MLCWLSGPANLGTTLVHIHNKPRGGGGGDSLLYIIQKYNIHLLLLVKIYGRMREVGLLKIIDGEDVPAIDYIKVKIKLHTLFRFFFRHYDFA